MMVIDGYVVDAELQGEPKFENVATTFPVEDGVEFTDHVRTTAHTLDCEGVVSDTPINTYVALQREIDGETGEEGPSRSAYTRLLEIHGRKEPVTVTCALGTFDNMLMLTFVPKREGGSIRFTASFQFMRIVENERTLVRVAVPRAANKDAVKKPSTFLESDRNNDQGIRRSIVPVGALKGTSLYFYETGDKAGQRVPDEVINKTIKDTGAVRVKYVNGQAVPYDPADYQPYVPSDRQRAKERPWWPDDDHVKAPGAPVNNNLPNLPGLGR